MRIIPLIFLTGCVDLKLVNVGPDGGLWTTPVVWENQDLPEGFQTRDVAAKGNRLWVADPAYGYGGVILEPSIGGTTVLAEGGPGDSLGYKIHAEEWHVIALTEDGNLHAFDFFGTEVLARTGDYVVADYFDGWSAVLDGNTAYRTSGDLSTYGPILTELDFVPNPYGDGLGDDIVVSDFGVLVASNGCHLQQAGLGTYLSWWKTSDNQGFLDEATPTELFPPEPSPSQVRLKWHVNSRRYGVSCENLDGSFRYQMIDHQYGVTVGDYARVRDVEIVDVNDMATTVAIVADDGGDYLNVNFQPYDYAFLGEFPFEDCDARVVDLGSSTIALVCLGDNRLAFGSVQDFYTLYDRTL